MRNRKDLNPIEGPDGIFRTTMDYTDNAMLCHFNMKKGAKVPLHNHPAEQIGYIISGRVKFIQDGGKSFIAGPGCGYSFKTMEYHGAEVLEDSELIECFAPAREEYK
jgi:quercetin dioxygenase-like cupin family protein